jgi:hypothetical protein
MMNPRRPAPGRKRTLNVLFAVLGLTLAGLAWIAMAWLMQRFQATRCPDDTFLWASSQIATALQFVPLFFPSLAMSFLAANWVVASIPGAPQFFDRFAAGKTDANYGRAQRPLIKFCLMLSALALPVSVGAGLCQFCLQPDAIVYQPDPWTGFRHYVWQDVAAVTTTCHYHGGRSAGWNRQFILTMRDGAAMDVMTWPAAAQRAYPALARALHGQAFSFDSSGVERGCPRRYLSMLTQRP